MVAVAGSHITLANECLGARRCISFHCLLGYSEGAQQGRCLGRGSARAKGAFRYSAYTPENIEPLIRYGTYIALQYCGPAPCHLSSSTFLGLKSATMSYRAGVWAGFCRSLGIDRGGSPKYVTAAQRGSRLAAKRGIAWHGRRAGRRSDRSGFPGTRSSSIYSQPIRFSMDVLKRTSVRTGIVVLGLIHLMHNTSLQVLMCGDDCPRRA
jgi:hypothetical protein